MMSSPATDSSHPPPLAAPGRSVRLPRRSSSHHASVQSPGRRPPRSDPLVYSVLVEDGKPEEPPPFRRPLSDVISDVISVLQLEPIFIFIFLQINKIVFHRLSQTMMLTLLLAAPCRTAAEQASGARGVSRLFFLWGPGGADSREPNGKRPAVSDCSERWAKV
ncbi:uncharacterized protein FYW61_004624 isoform 1-T2 [Anableps anableps]